MSAALTIPDDTCSRYALRFQPLSRDGRALLFPCDAKGQVNMDDLSTLALNTYLFARAVIGCDFALPRIVSVAALA